MLPVHVKAPQYFAERSYKNPTDITDGPLQYAYNMKGTPLFGWLQQNPVIGKRFGNMMTAWLIDRPMWIDPGFYPVQERLIQGMKKDQPDTVFLVDMGGGQGHDLERFKAKLPNVAGRLILQDLPEVIDRAKANLSPGIEATVHDFNTTQPVRGK